MLFSETFKTYSHHLQFESKNYNTIIVKIFNVEPSGRLTKKEMQ
jgi:hypothetical protein